MRKDGEKRLFNCKYMRLCPKYGLMLASVCLFIFLLKVNMEGNEPLSPPTMFKPSSNTTYHNPIETKSGKCMLNYFEDILLIIVYHFPFYNSIPLLKSFYEDAFRDILICGPKSYTKHHVMVVDVGRGFFGYKCAGEAIRRYPGYRGYLYINDDMVVNFWTFYNLDKEKFWLGGKILVNGGHIMGERPIRGGWVWWSRSTQSAKACEDSYLEIIEKYNSSEAINITNLKQTHLANCEGKKRCLNTWSDIFYIPKRFSDQFQRISFIFHKNRVFLEVAVPTIMSFIDTRKSWEKHLGLYLPDIYGSINFADGKLVWKHYRYDIPFIHPVKFKGTVAKLNREKLLMEVIPHSKQFTKC